MPLNQEQQKAVEYLSGPLLVLAGPGTGKTQLLSAKVAYILENVDAQPENILCLTFTEAGAQNMRDRLQSMIGKAALDVNIHTYHGFGTNILERYKNYAENFDRKLEAPIDDTRKYKIIHEIQQNLPVNDILRDADTKDLIDTISSAKSARLTAEDLKRIAEQNIQDSIELANAISPILLELKPREKAETAIAKVYQPILEVLLERSTPEPIVGNIERIANVLAKDLHKVITEVQAAEKPSVKQLTDWKTKNLEIYVRDAKHPEIKSYRLKDHIANLKLYSLSQIMQKYETALQASGLYDFDDMIECAIKYLKTDAGFRMQLSEQFQYILLDEFQDTNASQFELIKLLTDYEKPVVMAVGDDDQAIFEFQGANASNLRDFQDYYHAEIITLLDNYRSSGEVLGLSRKIAEQIDDSFAKNYQIDKTLRSMQDVWRGEQLLPPQVVRHEFAGTVAEYYWIAQEIRRLVDAGENPNEIAVIAPKHKNIAPLLPYLKAQGLDVTYEKRDNILVDPKIAEIIKLARFMYQLSQRQQPVEYLLEILSYPFWQVSPTVALKAVEQKWGVHKSVVDYLAGDPQLEQIAHLLAGLATVAETAPLELWLDYLVGNAEFGTAEITTGNNVSQPTMFNLETGQPIMQNPAAGTLVSPILSYYQAHCSEVELLEFYENLATLRQKVSSYVRSLQPDESRILRLKDFVAALDDFELAQTEIMRVSVYRDSGRAVQVMTSHKSKGLEFKHVFLTSVDDASWGKSKGNNNKLVLPKNLTQIRHTGNTDGEKLRLFFVAITRAKESLIMTSAMRKEDGSDNMRLRYLSESSRDSDEQKSPYLLEPVQNIVLHDDLTVAEKIETLRLNWVSAYQKLEPEAMAVLAERMKDYRLSATDLTGFIDIIYAGPQVVYQRKVLHAPAEPADFSMCYGTVLHTVFEQVTSRGLDDTQALEVFRNEAKQADLDDAGRKDLLDKGERSLKIALQEFGGILRHEHARAELNLSPERLNFNGVPITGQIDHLEINPQAKTIEVYDFKTGKYYDKKWDSQPSLYKYRLQLGFYKLMLNLSRNYRDYKVTKGHILFVTPDNDDKVYDKVYEFNETDDAELKQLAKAVYAHLISLDFVQNDELFIEADKSRTMKQVREFIEKVVKK